MVKLGVVKTLKSCLMSSDLSRKVRAWQVINKILASNVDLPVIQQDLFDNSLLHYCLTELDDSKQDEEDEMYDLILETVSASIVKNKTNCQLFMSQKIF